MPPDTTLLLDLLREAGEEAVTLDELEIVGVVDPAEALRRLEEAGHHLQRVVDTKTDGSALETVRLAAREEAAARSAIDWPTFEWRAVPAEQATPTAEPAGSTTTAARAASLGLVAIVLLLLTTLARRR